MPIPAVQLSGQQIIEVLQENEEDGESGVEQHQVVKLMLQKLLQLSELTGEPGSRRK